MLFFRQKVKILETTLSLDMQTDATQIATQAMEKFEIKADMAAYIKKEFDKKYNPTWHCIVGKGALWQESSATYHIFSIGSDVFILFRTDAV